MKKTEIESIQKSIDGSIKYSFNTLGKGVFEAIYFEFDGKYRGKMISDNVICVSTQIGCPMKCIFCETGKLGFIANLTNEEINMQVKSIQKDAEERGLPRANYIALMGMGEPLLNLPNIKRFYYKNHSSYKGISLSTSGLVDGIKNIALDDLLDFTLYISLHTPYDKQRNLFIPINQKWPIKEVLKAGELYAKSKNRKTVLTYMIMPNINDTTQHFADLVKIVDPELFSVQFTCFNSPKDKRQSETKQRFNELVPKFSKVMEEAGIEYDIQVSKGSDIAGGCGQLAADTK